MKMQVLVSGPVMPHKECIEKCYSVIITPFKGRKLV